MELVNDDEHITNKFSLSPFCSGLKASPQPWELHDVDFLLPDSCLRSYSQDLSSKCDPNLFESYANKKSFARREGADWQGIELSEASTSDLSTYFSDDILPDKILTQSPSPPTKLRVNATSWTERNDVRYHRNDSADSKEAVSVVSPTTVDKKILVTDRDLKLFSSSNNMKALRKAPSTSRKKPTMQLPVPTCPSPLVGLHSKVPHLKRHVSLDNGEVPSFQHLKRTKSFDQSAWNTKPMWCWGQVGGLHKANLSYSKTSLDYNDADFNRPNQIPVGDQPSPMRKIGIYSPIERQKRLKRFHEKRKHRVYHKRIKYDCRKRLANSCPRIKGRFVRKSEFLSAKKSKSTPSPTAPELASIDDSFVL